VTDFDRLEKALRLDEGFRPEPYKDTKGLWTIGIGRCLETNPLTVEELVRLLNQKEIRIEITEAGAEWLAWRAMRDAAHLCENTFSFWPDLNEARQNALVSMVYQMGLKSVCGFRRMILAIEKAIHDGDWGPVYDHGSDSEWFRKDTPARAERVLTQLVRGEFPAIASQIKT
jgi:GH24 family phage-related lysozyme (muramidase)